MNKQRRKRLSKIEEKIRALLDEIADIRDEEQEAYDNLPESFQDGERGELMSEIIDKLDDAYDNLETAADIISEAVE